MDRTGVDWLSDESADGWWSLDADALVSMLGVGREGLTSPEASTRLTRSPQPVGRQMSSDIELLVRQFRSPILMLLIAAAVLSQLLGEKVDAAIIAVIVLTSGVLGFFQERGAVRAVHSLMSSVQIHCRAIRDGVPREIALREIVRGDVVELHAGDVIPGDCLVLEANEMRVDESALTGEAYPRHKRPGVVDRLAPLVDRTNAVHFGTHVVSGEGRVLVVDTGAATEFGRVASHVAARHVPTSFERGVTQFGVLLLRSTAVLVASVFVTNLVLHRPFIESLLFSLALAVGLTPQMLPAIVTLSLSRGATEMAHRRVIVKRLEAIEDIGGIDVLCTDKTGTLTIGAVALDAALDVDGREDGEVARLAWLNANHQTGFLNPVDQAVMSSVEQPRDGGRRVAEMPYDFERKRLSVAVAVGGTTLMITKGAFEKVLDVCDTVRGRPVGPERSRLREMVADMSAQGLRVLGIATRPLVLDGDDVHLDEAGMDFVGFLTFLDPPKPGAREAIIRLAGLNISTRLVTGDHRLAARHIADLVGIPCERILTGAEIGQLDDESLQARVLDTGVFAEVTPIDKERVVRALSRSGRSVAFLGDGINDAPAIHAADVGISVDTAVDVAKESADVVLLDKELGVIGDGVEAGRRIFANTLKYVYVTTSANFGNMLSMAAAALFLPFLPLMPAQILLLNFMSDIPGTTIATDRVDEEQLRTSRRWDIHAVRSFMIVFGVTSAVFDLMTFAILRWGFDADATSFRSGWFVESTVTELAAMLVLRTSRTFHRSRPSAPLAVSSVVVLGATIGIPYSPLAGPLGLDGPSWLLMAALLGVTVGYVFATEFAKRRFPRLLGAYG